MRNIICEKDDEGLFDLYIKILSLDAKYINMIENYVCESVYKNLILKYISIGINISPHINFKILELDLIYRNEEGTTYIPINFLFVIKFLSTDGLMLEKMTDNVKEEYFPCIYALKIILNLLNILGI